MSSDSKTEAVELCVIVLAMCGYWFETKAPDAVMDTEFQDGEFYRARLRESCEYALAQYREAFGDDNDDRTS